MLPTSETKYMICVKADMVWHFSNDNIWKSNRKGRKEGATDQWDRSAWTPSISNEGLKVRTNEKTDWYLDLNGKPTGYWNRLLYCSMARNSDQSDLLEGSKKGLIEGRKRLSNRLAIELERRLCRLETQLPLYPYNRRPARMQWGKRGLKYMFNLVNLEYWYRTPY
jgi:hypothetical protein